MSCPIYYGLYKISAITLYYPKVQYLETGINTKKFYFWEATSTEKNNKLFRAAHMLEETNSEN